MLTAGVSLGTGIAIVGVLSHVIDMNSFSGQLALLIGLGVGVDYALFIVTRYRQGLLRGLTSEQAVIESLDTSGRAVMFAGIIVCIAMLGMFALGVSFLYGVAVAAAITVWFTMLAALTLTPALLGFFGTLVLRRRERRSLREHRLADSDESTRVGALGRIVATPARGVRRGRSRRHGPDRNPVLLDATGLRRRGKRPRRARRRARPMT